MAEHDIAALKIALQKANQLQAIANAIELAKLNAYSDDERAKVLKICASEMNSLELVKILRR